MQHLNKILFLLDEISQVKQRISISTNVTQNIEIALLQAKIVELYGEIQQYNRETLQPTPQSSTAPQQPVKESFTQQNVYAEKPEFKEPVAQPQLEKQPVAQPIAAKPKEATDFEKKREKLLRDEQENFTPAQQTSTPAAKTPEPVYTEQAKQPEPVMQKPSEQKLVQTTEKQPAAQQEKPVEQPKQDMSKIYAQARENAASGTATQSSLNEKLANPQASLNDKFQVHVKKNLADKLKLSPISNLTTAININQKIAFTNQLFRGEDKTFKHVLTTVNSFKNFSEAKFFIQSDVAPQFNWSEDDALVQEFMELVYRKFL